MLKGAWAGVREGARQHICAPPCRNMWPWGLLSPLPCCVGLLMLIGSAGLARMRAHGWACLPAWLDALLSPPYPWLGCPMQLNKFPVPSSPLAGLPRANLLRPQSLPGGKEW